MQTVARVVVEVVQVHQGGLGELVEGKVEEQPDAFIVDGGIAA